MYEFMNDRQGSFRGANYSPPKYNHSVTTRKTHTMIKTTCSTLILFLSGATACLAQWTQVGSEDFESYSFGDPLSGDWHKVNNSTNTTVNQFITDETGGTNTAGKTLPANVAGSGKALYYFDDSSSGTARAGLNLNTSTNDNYAIAYVSVDFSFVNVDTTPSDSFGVIGLMAADNTTYGSPDSRAVSINIFTDGSMTWAGGSTSVSNPTGSHNLAIVANGSGSSYSYSALDGSGTISLASKTFDIYLDDTLVGASVAFTTDTIELGRFGITTFSSDTNVDFMIDNLNSFSAIPENSRASMIVGLFALIILAPSRRFMNRR